MDIEPKKTAVATSRSYRLFAVFIYLMASLLGRNRPLCYIRLKPVTPAHIVGFQKSGISILSSYESLSQHKDVRFDVNDVDFILHGINSHHYIIRDIDISSKERQCL